MTATLPEHTCTCPTVEVEVVGALDLSVAARLREQLFDALSLRPSRLVVDLSGCTFFDVCGINLLLEVHRAVWQQDGRLVLRGAQERHHRLLALMGLRDVFEVSEPAVPDTDPSTAEETL